MARALLLDDAAHRAIHQLIEHADQHRFDVEQILAIMSGECHPCGDDPAFVCEIRRGYRCVYSIEAMSKGGYARHLSVSIDQAGAYPGVHAIKALMQAFGFVGELEQVMCYPEGHTESINIIEPLIG